MPSQTQTRVLYVDDDPDSREMLKTLLAISGSTFRCCDSRVCHVAD